MRGVDQTIEEPMRHPNQSLKHFILIAGALCCACAFGDAAAADLLGTKPAHIAGEPTEAPNSQAITIRIWAPGIDDGYVPQGISIADGHLLVSSYQSTDPKIGGGPCRVYKLDPHSGRTEGQFDMPETCKHAGGIVYAGNGMLIVADTRRLYRIDMAKAFADGNTGNALRGTITLGGEVKGSFVDFRDGAILVGSYEKEASKAKAFYLPYELFDRHDDIAIDEHAATRSFPIAALAQGAAFDPQGYLWLAFSNSKKGLLQKLDPLSGKVLAEHQMINGIEDLGFDAQGRLWAVSEAGSLRWSTWSTVFPIVFQMDVGKLQ
jgi:hypothetical protein